MDRWLLFIHDNIFSYKLAGSCEEKKENYMLCKYNLNLKIENDFYYNF